MSWLNSSLSSLKGQITNFAQEVLAETGNDDETNLVDTLEVAQKQKEELKSLCTAQENEIASLRKQITDLLAKHNDGAGRTSRTAIDKNASLEDSWCWEPENIPSDSPNKQAENDRTSESSNSGDLISIPLDPAGHDAELSEKFQKIIDEREHRLKKVTTENSSLTGKITKLKKKNKELESNLEELDNQHNIEMKEIVSLKNEWQDKWNLLNGQHTALTQEHELQVSCLQKDLENLQKKFLAIQDAYTMYVQENEVLKLKLENVGDDSKKLKALEEEVENLKVKLKEMEDEKNDLETKLSGDITKKCKVEDDFIVLQEDDVSSSSSIEQKYSELQIELDALKQELSDVQKDREALRKEMQTKVLNLNYQNESLVAEVEVSKETLTKNANKIKELQDKLERAQSSENDDPTLLSNDRLLNLQKTIDDLKCENETLRKETENQKEEISNLTETVKNCEANASDVESKLMLENVNLQKRLIDLKSSINKNNAESNSSDNAFSVDDIKQLLSSYTNIDIDVIDKSTLESAFKSISDKIWKIDVLQKNLKEMSEEVLHLSEEKAAIEHDRKTLQADIEHYEMECNELMKNNEILLNELENYKRNKLETIHENNEETILLLEKQLEEANNYRTELESQITDKLSETEQLNVSLKDEVEYLQGCNENLVAEASALKSQIEILENEKSNLIFEINEMKTDDNKTATEQEVLEYKNKRESLIARLEEEKKAQEERLLLLQEENNKMKNELEGNKDIISKQKEQLEELIKLQENIESLKAENETLKSENTVGGKLNVQLQEMKTNEKFLENHVSVLTHGLQDCEALCTELNSEIDILRDNNTNLMAEVTSLKSQVKGLESDKSNLIFEMNEMRTDDNKSEAVIKLRLHEHETQNESLKAQLDRLSKDHADLVSSMQAQKANFLEVKKKTDEKILELEKSNRQEEHDLQAENQTLKSTVQSLQEEIAIHQAKITQLEELQQKQNDSTLSGSEVINLQQTIDNLNQEKANLITSLTAKHNENTQYYMEIQRLDQLLQAEIEKSKTLSANCVNCGKLQEDITAISTTNKIELEKLRDQINFLKEKSDILTTNLLTEQTNQKLLQQEKCELIEKNVILERDLERLRQHLVELEDAHTQETLEMQNIIDETKAKMHSLQEEVSKSSNAYTSASIRANQHAETLQAQYLLVSQQRDELASKLSIAEDRESKNQAALVNLQCALEQFQKEKDADILSATQRIRKEMQNEQEKQNQLQLEINSLQKQLAEANQGLLAAARLSDQLEISQVTIAALKEEIAKQQDKVEVLDEKLRTTIQSQDDKVEKNLVKSLLIGYIVSSNQNDKNQILKLISSVLDFNQAETDKIGLNKAHGGWLTGILSGGAQQSDAHTKDSLAQAFVNFLEKESQPRTNAANMPNLLNITNDSKGAPTGNTTTSGRKLSSEQSNNNLTTTTSGGGGAVQPILLNENVLEQFAPTRNSSSILKDILSDS